MQIINLYANCDMNQIFVSQVQVPQKKNSLHKIDSQDAEGKDASLHIALFANHSQGASGMSLNVEGNKAWKYITRKKHKEKKMRKEKTAKRIIYFLRTIASVY